MVGQLLGIAAILLSAVFFLMGNGLIGTLTPLRAGFEGYSPSALGALGAAYYAGFTVGCLLGPYLFARTGHIRAFAIAAALTAVSVLLQSIIVAPLGWFLLRAGGGIGVAVLYMTLESWLNERATNETRGHVLSTYIVVNLSSIILGQWLLLLAAPQSFELFVVGAICYCLCLVPVGLTRLPQPNPQIVPRIEIAKLFKVAPVGAAGCITVGLANSAFWTLGPVYGMSLQLDIGQVAFFMSVFIAGGALVQWPLGRISDRIDRRFVIAVVCTVASFVGLALGVFGELIAQAPQIFYPLIFVQGAVMLPLYAVSIAHANDRVPNTEFLQTSAGLLMIFAAASILGPLLASTLTTLVGGYSGALFIFIALVNAAMAFFAFLRERIRERPPQEEREAFAPLPHGSVAALTLDPRAPDDVQ
jgi:MFS family permease